MTDQHSADSAVGERLKQAREAAGMSLADASARMKVPARVVHALEDGDWSALGAAVFVKGQVRSYARVLGVDVAENELPGSGSVAKAPPLVSRAHVPRYRHVAENLGRRAVYVVLTAALVVPVWLTARGYLDTPTVAVAPLDLPPGALPAPQAMERTPLVASITPLPVRSPIGPRPVVVEFTGDSWVQFFGPDGAVVEKGLLRAGDRRELKPEAVSRVVLGNTAAVQLRREGQAIDIAPYTRANVARFTLSSDGSLAPVAP